jgi:hypothetical protein
MTFKLKSITYISEEIEKVKRNFSFEKSSTPHFTYSHDSQCFNQLILNPNYNEIQHKHRQMDEKEKRKWGSGTTMHRHVFLLGIKKHKKYHLNIVIYDALKNIVFRFDPNGINFENNLTTPLINTIVNTFNCKKSPTFKYNTRPCRMFNGNNCVLSCLNFVKNWAVCLDTCQ